MVRIKTLSHTLSIWVFPDDHAPPHFHVMSPETDVIIDLRTLTVVRGRYKRTQLTNALAWAAEPGNRAFIEAEWRRLNERG